MNRASPAELRRAMIVVNEYKNAGILFVAMPVFSPEEHAQRVAEAGARLAQALEDDDE